jgi:hypothetical protein
MESRKHCARALCSTTRVIHSASSATHQGFTMSVTSRILVALFTLTVGLASAFSPLQVGLTQSQSAQSTTSQLQVAPPVETAESARGLFLFWFFGASGGAGLARFDRPFLECTIRFELFKASKDRDRHLVARCSEYRH